MHAIFRSHDGKTEEEPDGVLGERAEVTVRTYPDVEFSGLGGAIEAAKRAVLASDKAIMLQAEACFRNRNQVRTKYRCWIDERGSFNECALA